MSSRSAAGEAGPSRGGEGEFIRPRERDRERERERERERRGLMSASVM
jgi:hypothetical protein